MTMIIDFKKFTLAAIQTLTAISLVAAFPVQGQDAGRTRARDYLSVQEFVNSKRTIPYDNKDKELKINGSARVNLYYRTESMNGVHVRGHHAVDSRGIPISNYDFESEFNLKLAYKCGKAYSKMRVQFCNPMGIDTSPKDCKVDPDAMGGSGVCDDLCLREAWIGYHLCENEKSIFDIEVGRRRLYQIFDSRIEFNARFDGILLRYLHHLGPKTDAFIKVAPFVVDNRTNHYAFITEVGVFNLMQSDFDFKYSCVDWKLVDKNRCGVKDALGSDFIVSQWATAYNFRIKWLKDQRAQFYGAFLINTACPTIEVKDPEDDTVIIAKTKPNIGWYVGFITGNEELNDPGEWAFDMNYQYVEALSIPEKDARGIKRGNILKDTFTSNQRGNTNYKGWHFEGAYCVTRCLTLDMTYDISHQIQKILGGTHSYSKLELDIILSF
jgi:hypothetical protein